MDHDVIVIGGSYAGMAASLQLLRARRSVLVIDAGLRRNRFAAASHGFLGQDGVDPAVIAQQARRQLEAYPTLTWIDGGAVSVTGERDSFIVGTAEGTVHHGRRILFATGVTDLLPQIAGLADRWGRSIFHCPYCHGYELNQGRIGVIATGPMSAHQAQHLTEWGIITLLTNGVLTLAPEMRQTLANKAVTIEDTPIAEIEGGADVRLADGRLLPFAGLFTSAKVTSSSTLPAEIGCTIAEGPMGEMIGVDASKRTSVPGIFACGDLAQMPHSLSIAVGDGALAGLHLHRSLVWGDADF
jgi:thioredoxin reductase